MNPVHRTVGNVGLARSSTHRLLGGVCGGLARRFGISPTVMRILFVVTLVVIPGSQLIVYPVLWLVMPLDSKVPAAISAHDPTR